MLWGRVLELKIYVADIHISLSRKNKISKWIFCLSLLRLEKRIFVFLLYKWRPVILKNLFRRINCRHQALSNLGKSNLFLKIYFHGRFLPDSQLFSFLDESLMVLRNLWYLSLQHCIFKLKNLELAHVVLLSSEGHRVQLLDLVLFRFGWCANP